jgi:dihydroorotate dehydrogenase electron transfer subunit
MLVAVMGLPKIAVDAEVLSNETIGNSVKKLVVACSEIVGQANPGEFVHLRVDRSGLLLRRPISIADTDIDKGQLTFIYRIIGKGTAAMAELRSGDTINCLGPMGHGFSLDCEKPLLIGGGIGIAPLLFLAKKLNGKASILMGGRTTEEMFWPEIFKDFVKDIFITTDDGSMGTKGFTITALPQILQDNSYDRIVVCGPEIMMRGIAKIAAEHHISCQVSMEKRMACGLGACLSCTCNGNDNSRKKVCKDGPVFWAWEVL